MPSKKYSIVEILSFTTTIVLLVLNLLQNINGDFVLNSSSIHSDINFWKEYKKYYKIYCTYNKMLSKNQVQNANMLILVSIHIFQNFLK